MRRQTRVSLSVPLLVVAAGVLAAGTVRADEGADEIAPASASILDDESTGGDGTSVVAPSTPDDSFVAMAADPSFTFRAPLVTDAAPSLNLPAYAVARDLVTNDEYAAFVAATGHAAPLGWTADGKVPVGLGLHPVVQVSRGDAEAYATWESTLAPGWTVRLPSEAELENAARGTADTVFPWGDAPDVSYDPDDGHIDAPLDFVGVVTADYLRMYGDSETGMVLGARSGGGIEDITLGELLSESDDGTVAGFRLDGGASGFVHTELYARTLGTLGYTTAVGSFAATPSGLDDMAGNVWEWTESQRLVPTAGTSGTALQVEAAVRGCAWSSELTSCTSGYRGEGRDPAGTFADVGFRLVASPAPASAPSG
jgi:formylglycine-generating enzyme required for sulfatase activity